MRCSHYGEEGHNTKTHHRPLPPKQKKKTGEAFASKGKRKPTKGKKQMKKQVM